MPLKLFLPLLPSHSLHLLGTSTSAPKEKDEKLLRKRPRKRNRTGRGGRNWVYRRGSKKNNFEVPIGTHPKSGYDEGVEGGRQNFWTGTGEKFRRGWEALKSILDIYSWKGQHKQSPQKSASRRSAKKARKEGCYKSGKSACFQIEPSSSLCT